MNIRPELWERIRRDVDARLFVQHFKEEGVKRVLVVGVHDEPTAHILAENGFEVVGVDLRKYDKDLPQCNFRYVQGDFCTLDEFEIFDMDPGGARDFENEPFDAFVSLSTIEHFGFGAYGEGDFHRYYDVIGMWRAAQLLRNDGYAYVTVPFGKQFLECLPHYRIYDVESVKYRLAQDMELVEGHVAISAALMINGKVRHIGDTITDEEALTYQGMPPHLSVLAIMKKVHREPRLGKG